MIGTILFIILVSIFLFFIYRITLKYKPKIIYNESGEMTQIISNMLSLKKPYKPNIWLFNGHLQTLFGLKFRGKSSYKPIREDVFFKDGGQATIEYFVDEKNLAEDSPIIYLEHTMGGGSRESCTNFMAILLMKKKFRVVVCTCRGCNGSKITSRRLYNGAQADDLKTIIDHVNKKYPKAKNKFLIGFSLGSMIACQYGIEYDDLDGIICISHTIHAYRGTQFLEKGIKRKLYYETMMNHLKKTALKSGFYTEEEIKQIKKTKLFIEYDNIVTAKNMGLKSALEYYDLLELGPKIDKFKVPIIFILGEDDPFSRPEWVPVDDIKKSKYVAFITTKEGGHVGFFQNCDTKITYSEEISLDFIKVVSELKNH